ncbi:MAG: HAD-IC family P-type ATPase [Mollicutes bacterium]|nr:HAD-IC family P-type ATPase [Mollicutes bacterium]
MENKKIIGLTSKEVEEKIKLGKINIVEEPKTKSISEIVKDNSITFFNILNLILAGLVIFSGLISGRFFYGLKNSLFLGVAIINTIISIIHEILAKKTIDKLNVLRDTPIIVIRDGKKISISKEEIVLKDVIEYKTGRQIVTDGIIISGFCEVNESFITGEVNNIFKKEKDEVLSGSFIVSGTCYIKVTKVGKDNYISKITLGAKYIKDNPSVIYKSFDKLIKILSICLVPIGTLFLINQLKITNFNWAESLISMVGAVIGMIPEGLILLTSSAMAVSVVRLKKSNILVQELYATENLARVDIICLDKTGTITTGNMKLHKIDYLGQDEEKVNNLLSSYISSIDDNSSTITAIKEKINLTTSLKVINSIPFSSERKYSGVEFKDGSYYLGSPDNLLKEVTKEVSNYQNNYRVLVFSKGHGKFNDLEGLTPVCYLLIEDEVKIDAKKTLDYFKQEQIKVKIISGDNIKTIKKIASKAGIQDFKAISLDNIDDTKIEEIVMKYDIFGRVKPHQKEIIISSLQKKGHFVAMTGDGVNDTLALKAADCSIAMESGSEAAKNVSQFILLDNRIENLPVIFKEGRRSINNIERSSSLLLTKTIFTVILILICLFLDRTYFFIPIHLTLITACTISIPSFILALEYNNEIVKPNFLKRVFLRSFPCSLTVVFNVLVVYLFQTQFHLSEAVSSTLMVLLTASTEFIFLNSICKPYTPQRIVMILGLVLAFIYCAVFQYDFFSLTYLNKNILLIYTLLLVCSLYMFNLFKKIIDGVFSKNFKNKFIKNVDKV